MLAATDIEFHLSAASSWASHARHRRPERPGGGASAVSWRV